VLVAVTVVLGKEAEAQDDGDKPGALRLIHGGLLGP